MPLYRFYSIKIDGHVAGPPINFEGPTDKDAIDEAKQIIDGKDIEIWEADRLVAYLTPDEKGGLTEG